MTYEDMPHNSLLTGLLQNVSQAFNIILKHPLEKIEDLADEEEELDDPKKKKFLQTIVGADEEKRTKVSDSEAVGILKKLSNTPSYRLKNVMFKRMLLKLILFFYEEKMKDKGHWESFGVFVFSMLIKKYIMKKAAESKFNHLIASCIKYKSIIRVRVFGRFLGLYDAFDNDDLAFFMECLSFLITSPSGIFSSPQDSLEVIPVPYVRCIECIKYFEKSLPKNGVTSLRIKLEKMRKIDKLNRLGVVDIDEFLEQIVETYNDFNKSAKNFMRSIYEAADLNDDGYLQFKELELLLRYLSQVSYEPSRAVELFDEYSETFLSEDDEEVKAISFDNLCQMNKENKLFVASDIKKLTGVVDAEDAVKRLESVQEKIEVMIAEFLWRFTETQMWDDHMDELKTMLDSIRMKVSNFKSPETAYLAVTLIDLESTRVIVEEKMYEFLPDFALGLG